MKHTVIDMSPIRIAYADPPYIGQAKRHYAHDPRCAEVDHAALITRLEQYDAWALSCSSPSLKQILPMCPPTVRCMAWVKPFAVFKPGVNPAYAWEPVIVRLSDRRRSRSEATVRDWCSCNITLKRGLVGAKPEAFCFWLFSVLHLRVGDTFDDLFPGSGAVTTAFNKYIASI